MTHLRECGSREEGLDFWIFAPAHIYTNHSYVIWFVINCCCVVVMSSVMSSVIMTYHCNVLIIVFSGPPLEPARLYQKCFFHTTWERQNSSGKMWQPRVVVAPPPWKAEKGEGVSDGGQSPEKFCQSYVQIWCFWHMVTKFSSQMSSYVQQKFHLGAIICRNSDWGHSFLALP